MIAMVSSQFCVSFANCLRPARVRGDSTGGRVAEGMLDTTDGNRAGLRESRPASAPK